MRYSIEKLEEMVSSGEMEKNHYKSTYFKEGLKMASFGFVYTAVFAAATYGLTRLFGGDNTLGLILAGFSVGMNGFVMAMPLAFYREKAEESGIIDGYTEYSSVKRGGPEFKVPDNADTSSRISPTNFDKKIPEYTAGYFTSFH